MELNQKINCSVTSCRYNDCGNKICELRQIEVKACPGCSDGTPEDESMCGNYISK